MITNKMDIKTGKTKPSDTSGGTEVLVGQLPSGALESITDKLTKNIFCTNEGKCCGSIPQNHKGCSQKSFCACNISIFFKQTSFSLKLDRLWIEYIPTKAVLSSPISFSFELPKSKFIISFMYSSSTSSVEKRHCDT